MLILKDNGLPLLPCATYQEVNSKSNFHDIAPYHTDKLRFKIRTQNTDVGRELEVYLKYVKCHLRLLFFNA